MYQNIATKVLTGEVRLSYVNLTQPRASQPGQEPKYSVTLLIPKTDTATFEDVNASFQAAYNEGVSKKWNGARPQSRGIIHDGDGLRPSGLPFGDECKGCWVLTASSKQKPQVVDKTLSELPPTDIYSGMYARVTINFFPFDTAGNKGVGCGLGNVFKTREGDPLSGGASAESDFAGIAGAPAAAPVYAAPQPAAAYNPAAYAAPAAPAQNTTARPAVNPVTGQPW